METMEKMKYLFPNSLLAETYVALQAKLFGIDLGLKRIEGDAIKVVKAIQGSVTSLNSIRMLIFDIKYKLQSYAQWSVRHINRESNVATHTLEKNALDIPDFIIDMEETT